jgi:truncated hemoglobin YjbI/PAS domain-containing protein
MTIYEKIGGEAAIRAAVEGMYARILGDVVVSPFFERANIKRLITSQVAFFSQALGGPSGYSGPGMRALHQNMKIEQRHFERVVHHLVATLKDLKVDEATAAEIVALVKPLAKDIVTVDTGEDALAADNREALVFQQLIENSPINVMRADTDLIIRYQNEASRKTLTKLAHLLPCPVERVVGSSVDIFHKNPMHQRRILNDPRNLPHHANIQLGPETLSLLINPIYDAQRNFMGTMVTWEVVTEKVRLKAHADEYAAQVAALQEFQAVVHYDMDGVILDANDNLLKMYGYTLDEIKGKHHSMCIDERCQRAAHQGDVGAAAARGVRRGRVQARRQRRERSMDPGLVQRDPGHRQQALQSHRLHLRRNRVTAGGGGCAGPVGGHR